MKINKPFSAVETRGVAQTAKMTSSRRRRIIFYSVGTAITTTLLVLLVWQLLTPAPSRGGKSSSTSADPLKGKPAPNFTLPLLSNQQHTPPISLADFRGKAIILNFWASWCSPCQDEAPLLQAEWQKVHSRNIVFLGVDYQDTQSSGLNFLHTYHISYPNVFDATGFAGAIYDLTGLPTTYFINSSGVVVSNIPHQMTSQELQQNVQALLSTGQTFMRHGSMFTRSTRKALSLSRRARSCAADRWHSIVEYSLLGKNLVYNQILHPG